MRAHLMKENMIDAIRIPLVTLLIVFLFRFLARKQMKEKKLRDETGES